TPPDVTGIPQGDWQGLFEYADLVRADLRRYAADIDDVTGAELLRWTYQDREFAMTRRRLLVHIVLHEIRHLAQVALAARAAGVAPPGDHDLIYFEEFA